ncbi:hypothetical protein, partial [Sinorhizobium meliloti]|uniref:hypothetical protein n=1 Tax=Rhizobium meliloti TaxID=382 RepID=UPI001AECF8CE
STWRIYQSRSPQSLCRSICPCDRFLHVSCAYPYLTEAANRGIPLPEAMQQSLHKSVTQAASYYNNAERKNGRAARLIV